MIIELESKILGQLAAGKNEAYEYLYAQFYTSLLFFAERYVAERKTTEDMVQEVFLALFQQRIRFESMAHLKSYLYTSLYNRCMNHIRHQKVENRYANVVLSAEYDNQDHYAIEEDVYSMLVAAINTLPPQSREVMLLSLEQKTNAEIAQTMGLTIETVKSYKKNAKKRLIAYFDENGVSIQTIIVAIITSL